MKLRITQLIPAILVASALISSIIMFNYMILYEERFIKKDAVGQLNIDISRLQNILHNLVTVGNLSDARLNISTIAMQPSFRKLLLIDENDQVILANRYLWEGVMAYDISKYKKEIASEIIKTKKPQVYHEDEGRLIGYYPLVLRIENQKGLPINRVGVLFTEVDLSKTLARIHSDALFDSLAFGSLFLFTAIFIFVVLHYRISRRLKNLLDFAKSFAKGNMKVRAYMSGHDELTDLGKAFDEMAETIENNIANLKNAENSLIELNANLEDKVLERTSELNEAQRIARLGNWQWNIKMEELFLSDELYRILGFAAGEIKLDFDDFVAMSHPEDKELVSNAINNALEKEEKYSIDRRIITHSGSIRWVHEEAYVTFGSSKEPEIIKGITQDITMQKEESLNREQLERQLQQTQKMESLGQLTGGIAHDFNNILATIAGFVHLAKKMTIESEKAKLTEYLEQIDSAGKKAANLVRQMLAFSRTDSDFAKMELVSAASLLDENVSMLRPILPSSIEVNIHTAPNVADISVNPVMINQVLMNLCVNARDSMEDAQGYINISIKEVTINNKKCHSCFKPVSGAFVEISIADSGTGIKGDVLLHIFEPFFTTKEVGKGTGMGLSMVHGIMHKLHGHIFIESKIGVGTTFRLLFPKMQVKALSSDEQEISAERVNTIEGSQQVRILVVDDETSITLFLKELLEGYGYEVIIKNDSEKAFNYFSENSNQIDLIITDYTMPNMTGLQLAQSAIEIKSNQPVILCSGLVEQINFEKMDKLVHASFLEKPVDADELLNLVRKYTK